MAMQGLLTPFETGFDSQMGYQIMDKQETINKLNLVIAMLDYVNAELDRLFIVHTKAENEMKQPGAGSGG